jgi:hypothetical protein
MDGRQHTHPATTFWYRTRFTRGGGTSAASFSINSNGRKATCVVPSRLAITGRNSDIGMQAEPAECHTTSRFGCADLFDVDPISESHHALTLARASSNT